MKFGFVSGLPLSLETKKAWRTVGGVSLRMRETPEEWQEALDGLTEFSFLLNLGHTSFNPGDIGLPVINNFHTVGALMYPESVRKNLPDLAVPQPTEFNGPTKVWIKPPGYRGKGKKIVMTERKLVLPEDWDWQSHVDGIEYRVVTVGRRAVQGFQREGDNENREYGWTGLTHTPEDVLSAARQAARHFERSGYDTPHNTMYAWDIIQTHTGQVYLFEGNTCPGMSLVTAERVVNEITRQIEEDRIQ